jgi:Ribbon-helix-helix protein, copG family
MPQNRNLPQVQVTLAPEDLASLDRLAARLDPARPNRSAAVRHALRECLRLWPEPAPQKRSRKSGATT